MVKRDVNFIIRVFNTKVRDNIRNERIEERISNRRKRGKKKSTNNEICRFKKRGNLQ